MRRDLDSSQALLEAIQVADPSGGVGAFNWVLYELSTHPGSFDDVGEFVDQWLTGVDMPDEQMAWVLATSFGSGWQKVILARIGHDEENRLRLLEILRRASEANPEAPPYLGAGGGGSPRPPVDLIDTSVVVVEVPPMMLPSKELPSGSVTIGGDDSLLSRVRGSAEGILDKVAGLIFAKKTARHRHDLPSELGIPDSTTDEPIFGSDGSLAMTGPDAATDVLPERQFQVSQLMDNPRHVELEYSDRVKGMIVPTVGDLSFDADLIPEGGLATRWQISSNQEISAVSPGIELSTLDHGGVATRWFADFDLVLPKEANSDIVTLRCDGNGSQRLDIRIYSIGPSPELLRRISADVSTDGSTPMPDPEADEITEIDLGATRSLHAWTIPPDQLGLSIYGNDSLKVRPSSSSPHPVGAQRWPATSAIAPNVDRLRLSAERFREQHSDLFETIEAHELTDRLQRDLTTGFFGRTADWEAPDAKSNVLAEHQAGWATLAASDEAKDLAYNGFVLYDTLFPDDSPARIALDDLAAGSRVSVDWLLGAGNAAMPWNLMYTRPPGTGPVDAEAFLGMRFRWSWSKWDASPSQVLGEIDTAERLHLLYWHDDEIGTEAKHQRTVLAGLQNHRVVPTLSDSSVTSRDQAINELTKPTDAAILHFYCHCAQDSATKQTKLIFGPMLHEADHRVMGRDFGAADLEGAPLVFVNACESAAGDTYHVNQLEQMFFQRGCRAFMGTEIRVPVGLASRYSQVFFTLLETRIDGKQLSTGEAATLARRYLWLNYRNVGGLFYSYIHHYGLRMFDEPQGTTKGT